MWVASFKKNPRRAKSLAFVLVLSCYVCMVNVNLSRRARAIEIERERNLSIALPNFGCELTAPEFIVAAGNTTKTLLASYPGSGKRFVYQLIEGLTNHAPGDDHELSFNGLETLHIKTSYPHSEGVWSWGSRMDQMILLIRNPRWAIPSYHTMKFELLFSNSWYSSYLRIPFVYTHRPPVEDWDLWRDAYFESEMQNWLDFIDFWMEGGPNDGHCAPAGDLEDCHPQTVLDFDTFYTDHTSHEFTKLGKVLDAMENVDIIANYSRACIFEAVFNNNVPAAKMKLTHNSNRDGFGPAPSNKKFTSAQLLAMDQYLNSMIDKYSNEPWADNTNAKDLVAILTAYVYEISFEYQFQLDMGIP